MKAATFEGKECVNGHGSLRYIKTKQCVICNRIRLNNWRRVNGDKVRAYRLNDHQRNKRHSLWKRLNKGAVNAATARRRAAKALACPAWLSDSDKKAIQVLYKQAQDLEKQTGIPHHVDHIEPLFGKTSRGLHVLWNLQVIPAIDNLKKGNRR